MWRVWRALGESKTIYYCIDDYAALPGVDFDAVRKMDEELSTRADIVFIAAATLFKAKVGLNDNTFVSPHGVDVEHFGTANLPGRIPDDVAKLKRPIIGFFGLIEAWIDLDLIEYLARARPDWSFIMIGRVAVDHPGAKGCANVHFLGRRDYADLPEYGRSFRAAIIPYHPTQQVQNANPLKLREYLAMGKPIVTVRTPEIEKFADVVRIADGREEFLVQLDDVMSTSERPEDIAKRMAAVAESGWNVRMKAVVDRIESSCTTEQRHELVIQR